MSLGKTSGFRRLALIPLMQGRGAKMPGPAPQVQHGISQAVISHEHSVIFVHIPKTAGQSVETVFLRKLGLTWKQRAPLLLRQKTEGQPGPQRLAHLFAWEYVKYGYCTEQVFGAYTRFSVIRDPYSRAVSEFNYRGAKELGSFEDYYHSIPGDESNDRWRHLCPQHRYLRTEDDTGFLVDRILRYEELISGWRGISQQVFGGHVPLPRKNGPGKNF